MDIHGLRTLNLVGTILFGLIGLGIPVIFLASFGILYGVVPGGGIFGISSVVLIALIIIIASLTFTLYHNTVIGLDRGNFEGAKRWTLIGAIMGLIMGIIFTIGMIPFGIFLISYFSFDNAVWPKPYYYPPPGYYPYPPPYPYGHSYLPQQPTGINPCPNCGQPLRYVTKYQKWYCNNCKVYIKS